MFRIHRCSCPHLTTVRSGFPFSTIYVASSAPLPLPTFFAVWIAPAGTNKTSPALTFATLAVDLIFQRTFDHVDDLFARMRVPGSDISRVEVDAHLDDLASGRAEIVPLQVGSFGSRLLRLRHAQRQSACDDQHRHSNNAR